MADVLRDEGKEPVEREVPRHRRSVGRKPWAIEVRYPFEPPLGSWLRYQRYETRDRAERALAVNQRKAHNGVKYRLIGPDGEVVTQADRDSESGS